MSDLIEAYLIRLADRLDGGAVERARVLDEVRDHLLAAIEAETARGVDAAEATRCAIDRFGSPELIARHFVLSRRRWPNPLQRLGAFVRRGRPVADKADQAYRCSFCGKAHEQVRRLIAGPNFVYICNECVALCNQIIEREEGTPRTAPV